VRDLDKLFAALGQSKFRSRFRLSQREQRQLASKSLPVIMDHARAFLVERLAPALIPNDGKQTPMRGHPVFAAQHATATCCRRCLQKWHQIPRGSELTDEQLEYLLTVIERWLQSQTELQDRPAQRRLFD
jgi:hypothetical protein